RLETRVAGRVDEVQLAVLPLRVADRSGQRHLALLLVLVPVADARPLLDCAEPVGRAGLEEHGFDEGRFARPPMADHSDVTDLPRFRRSHGRSSLSACESSGVKMHSCAFHSGERALRMPPRSRISTCARGGNACRICLTSTAPRTCWRGSASSCPSTKSSGSPKTAGASWASSR